MINVLKIHNKVDLMTSISLCKQVFVEELLLNISLETSLDNFNVYLAYYKGDPVGTARWFLTNGSFKIERVAVLDNYRNLGVGSMLISTLLKEITTLKPSADIHLFSQIENIAFYKKLGFIKDGDVADYFDVPHNKMVYSKILR